MGILKSSKESLFIIFLNICLENIIDFKIGIKRKRNVSQIKIGTRVRKQAK